MLKRLGETEKCVDPSGVVVRIRDAAFPAPFLSELEFNAPVHGTWNIVHTGMLIPGAHQIYVCADNCMRGVVLTAAEMNAADRFSFVIVKEKDLLMDNLETITIEGVSDVIERLPQKPKVVLLFTVCLHHFVGCDLKLVYDRLGKRFPDICFVRCFMDPIMRKNGLTPDQKMRKSMYDPLRPLPENEKSVSLIGSDLALDETSDLVRMIRNNGYEFREIPNCRTYEEYLKLAESKVFLVCYPSALYGAKVLANRLNKKLLYLPACFGYEEIKAHLDAVSEALDIEKIHAKEQIEKCERALSGALKVIGDTPVVIDYTFHPRPLGLARILLSHGFAVDTVYLDAVSGEEKEDFDWLVQNAPDLKLAATVQVKMRVLPRDRKDKVLALGQKAAWFSGTPHFVNLVEGAGLYGYDGICRLTERMVEAYREEKDTADLVVRKGWGCECCL